MVDGRQGIRTLVANRYISKLYSVTFTEGSYKAKLIWILLLGFIIWIIYKTNTTTYVYATLR